MRETPADRYADAYGRGADSYAEVLDPTLEPVARRIVDLAAPRPEDQLLDLATGTGLVAREAAQRGARVWGIDVAGAMVETARRRSSSSIMFLVGDAGSLPFLDQRFDVVTCGFGLSHMPDSAGVLGEVRRVLRNGGRFVESSWGSEGKNEAFAVTLRELGAASGGRVHAFADILDEDTWADPMSGMAVLSAAGFNVQAVTHRLTGRYSSPNAALDWTLAWPDYAETVASLTESDRVSFKSAAVDAIAGTDLTWWFAINYFVATKT